MTSADPRPDDAWTGYWRSGQSASCLFGPNTVVRLTRVWDACVDELPDGARLIDLATGNGAVARACAERARLLGKRLQIDAVDAALIDPPKYVTDPNRQLRDIHFQAAVRLEDLPFEDDVFDAVVSQFGFEYAEQDSAASEAIRILAPGGLLRLCVHARDGAVARDIDLRLQRLHGVLAESGPVTLVLALARAAESGNRNLIALKSRELESAVAQVRRLAERPPSDDAALFYSGEFLRLWERRERYDPSELRRSVEDGWKNATGVAARQEQMLRVAHTEQEMTSLAGRFSNAGLTVEKPVAVFDENRGVQIAWLLAARKPRP